MPAPFKNVFNVEFIEELVKRIEHCYEGFNAERFRTMVFDDDWEARELKQRMRHISICLRHCLPNDLSEAYAIIRQVAVDFGDDMDLAPMVFPDFVEHFGLDHPESLSLLQHLTRHSSSEFAIRPFIQRSPEQTMALLLEWAKSDNYHVRRCASEGCRPRLPWAMALPTLKTDPSPILPILEQLKDDPELYVRRSVANNLNDIAKDNPETVLAVAKTWIGHSEKTDWVVKHGCRTLLKQGHPEALRLFGFTPPDHITVLDLQHSQRVLMGESLSFSFQVNAANHKPLGKLRLEFAIDFMKANGKQARKVFQISEGLVKTTQKSVNKQFSFRAITTRKYYTGAHGLSVLVNGVEKAHGTFELCD